MIQSYQQEIQQLWKTMNRLNSSLGKNKTVCEKVLKIRVDFSDFQVSPVWGCGVLRKAFQEHRTNDESHALLFDSLMR